MSKSSNFLGKTGRGKFFSEPQRTTTLVLRKRCGGGDKEGCNLLYLSIQHKMAPTRKLRRLADTTPSSRIVLVPLQLSSDGSQFVSGVANSDATQQLQQQQPALGANDNNSTTQELPAGVPLLQVYVWFLACCAAVWLSYLLLPRGCKKAYVQKRRLAASRNKKSGYSDHPRQQAQQQQQQQQQQDDSHPTEWWKAFQQARKNDTANNERHGSVAGFSNFTQDSVLQAAEARRNRDLQQQQQQQDLNDLTLWEDIPIHGDNDGDKVYDQFRSSRNRHAKNKNNTMVPMSMAKSEKDLENHVTPAKAQSTRYLSVVPSPDHPQIKPLPADSVWRECYRRLQNNGMRLTAHGVQCPSKRIWLQYSNEDATLLWQTEFPRQVPTSATTLRASTVWVRGAMHRIPAGNVLYIDVGKKTTALLQTAATVAPSTCFSLLTQAGSLDLQANSKLERDAVVSALSYILDQVHQGSDWRRLYDESSTIVNGGGRSGSSVAGGSSAVLLPPDRQYNPSTVGAISNIGSDMFPPGPNEI